MNQLTAGRALAPGRALARAEMESGEYTDEF